MAIDAQMRSPPDERPAGSAPRSTLTTESMWPVALQNYQRTFWWELRGFAFDGYEERSGLTQPDRKSMLRRRVPTATEPACVVDQVNVVTDRLLATTTATRDRHRLGQNRLRLRIPTPMRRARVQFLLRQNATAPRQTGTEKVVPSRENHLDHGAGGDIATESRHEALCAPGSRPRRRRVALLRVLPMIPKPYPTAPFRRSRLGRVQPSIRGLWLNE